jgi:hypothetical protein
VLLERELWPADHLDPLGAPRPGDDRPPKRVQPRLLRLEILERLPRQPGAATST